MRKIVDLAADTRIVIINEAHDRPQHREFIRRLATRLAPLGYTHFAGESIPLLLPAGSYMIMGFHEGSDEQLAARIDIGPDL